MPGARALFWSPVLRDYMSEMQGPYYPRERLGRQIPTGRTSGPKGTSDGARSTASPAHCPAPLRQGEAVNRARNVAPYCRSSNPFSAPPGMTPCGIRTLCIGTEGITQACARKMGVCPHEAG